MIELRHFLDIVNKLKGNITLQFFENIIKPTINLARNDAFHWRSKNVITEVDAIDADVKTIETNQHVQSKFFTWL